MIRCVRLSRRARKQLAGVPRHIKDKLVIWVMAITLDGLEQTRKSPA